MEQTTVELHMDSDKKTGHATVYGNVDDIAQTIFAYLTTQPGLFKKIFEKYLNAIYGDDNNE